MPLLVTFDESMKTLPVGVAAFTPVEPHAAEGYTRVARRLSSSALLCLFSALFIKGLSRWK